MRQERSIFHRVSRRTVLKWGAGLTLTGVAGMSWGLATPGPERIVDFFPCPGWLYARHLVWRPPLITTNGIGEFLNYYPFKDPIVMDGVRVAITDFLKPYTKPRKMGEMWEKHIEFAKDTLTNHFPGKMVNLENTLFLAAIIHAAVFNPNFTLHDFGKLGFDTSAVTTYAGEYWLGDAYQLAYPDILPIDEKFCNSEAERRAFCLGNDRSIHIAHMFAMLTIWAHARIHGLSEAKRIPNFARLMIFGLPLDAAIERISELGGDVKEIIQTFNYYSGQAIIGEDGKSVRKGYADPARILDIIANRVGKKAAKLVLYDSENDPLTINKIGRTIDYMDSDRFYKKVDLDKILSNEVDVTTLE